MRKCWFFFVLAAAFFATAILPPSIQAATPGFDKPVACTVTVTDTAGHPLSRAIVMASVTVIETTGSAFKKVTAVTDAKGQAQLPLPLNKKTTLIVRHEGYKDARADVTPTDADSSFTIEMEKAPAH